MQVSPHPALTPFRVD